MPITVEIKIVMIGSATRARAPDVLFAFNDGFMFFPTIELNQFTYRSLPSGLIHGSITTTVFFSHCLF
jgi:hypothetical protein